MFVVATTMMLVLRGGRGRRWRGVWRAKCAGGYPLVYDKTQQYIDRPINNEAPLQKGGVSN